MKLTKSSWLLNKPVAHRGLWGNGITENSISAYENAVKNGYPIEIDLFLTTDNVLVSFHDDNLLRMTGVNKLIYEQNLSYLKTLSISKDGEKIPTFEEVLRVVNGKVPLLIEIKNQPNKMVVDVLVERLKSYKGEFAIQSFNPLYINRVKKLAPQFTRGILANSIEEDLKTLSFIKRIIVKHMPLNFLIKPHFIAHSYQGLPVKKRKRKGLPVISWTVTSKEIYNEISPYVDNIIFEHFIP